MHRECYAAGVTWMHSRSPWDKAAWPAVPDRSRLSSNHSAPTQHVLCFHYPFDNNKQNACQPGLCACGASLSSPGRLVWTDLIGPGNRQMMNVRQHHMVDLLLSLQGMCLGTTHSWCKSLGVHCGNTWHKLTWTIAWPPNIQINKRQTVPCLSNTCRGSRLQRSLRQMQLRYCKLPVAAAYHTCGAVHAAHV